MKANSSRLGVAFLILFTASLTSMAHQRGLTIGRSKAQHYYALVIGIEGYTHLPRLKTAVADATEVADLLKSASGFETKLLIDATRSQIVAALAAYRRELGPDTNLLVYYAGHGFNDKEAGKSYWLPMDATIEDTSN